MNLLTQLFVTSNEDIISSDARFVVTTHTTQLSEFVDQNGSTHQSLIEIADSHGIDSLPTYVEPSLHELYVDEVELAEFATRRKAGSLWKDILRTISYDVRNPGVMGRTNHADGCARPRDRGRRARCDSGRI
jgi:hypothetical protein